MKFASRGFFTSEPRNRAQKKKLTPTILFTISEVAEALRLSPATIYKLIAGGKITAIKIGRSTRIRVTEVERFVASQEVGQ